MAREDEYILVNDTISKHVFQLVDGTIQFNNKKCERAQREEGGYDDSGFSFPVLVVQYGYRSSSGCEKFL